MGTDLLALRIWIEYPEVWHWVNAGAGAPLPAAIIRRQVSVNQSFHEILRIAKATSIISRCTIQLNALPHVPFHQAASQS